jgi:hypothetical protein
MGREPETKAVDDCGSDLAELDDARTREYIAAVFTEFWDEWNN